MSSPYAPTKARVLPRRVHAKPRTLLDLTSPRVVQAPVVEDVVAASQDAFFGVEQEVPQEMCTNSASSTWKRPAVKGNSLPLSPRHCTIASKEETTAPTIQTPVSILNCTRKTSGYWARDGSHAQRIHLTSSYVFFYRHLLTRITDPPEKIKEYSVRLHSRNGRDDKLKSLPEPVANILQDMAEDMLGYGQDELKVWLDQGLDNSTFYKNLGANEEEHRANLEDLRNERAEWRPQIFKALQLALRDVRSYKYEAGKWISNQRRGKREVDGMIEAVPECSRYGS
ncbi:unnamed protein product [Cylicocyclus nassatus]|uniref:Uncharacterized protein n=1 Tax=Cylicocyclus nassatus TaxID=53992 RepID=A0AA36GFC4_CYLNA|nr:unnamed protein product [Cylicocyclus nassatus]